MRKLSIDVIQSAMELIADLENSFLSLGRMLGKARDENNQLFQSLLALPSLDRRTAYYLIAISTTFDALEVDDKELIQVGWTKLATLRPFVTAENVAVLLELAKQHSNYALRQILKGQGPAKDARVVALYLRPKEYETYKKALVSFGAKPVGRGLRGQEEALMKLIAAAKPTAK